MWQIEVKSTFLKSDSELSGHNSHIVQLKDGGKSEVLDFENNKRLCTVVAPENLWLGVAFVFDSKIGISKNGRAVPCQIVVLNKSSVDTVTLDRSGQKITLRATYLPDPLVKSVVQGICSLCHDVLESQVIQQCHHCGCKFHKECLVLNGKNLRCPACSRELGKLAQVENPNLVQPKKEVLLSSDCTEVSRRCRELSMHPEPTVILVGCGNIGSKLASQLPQIGVKRIVLIDPDRICVARNSRCCTLFASQNIEGQLKVEVLSEEIKKQTPAVQVNFLPMSLRYADIAKLREFGPSVMVGAVDSRSARNGLAEVAKALDCPLIDAAIAGSHNEIVAKVSSMWPSLDGLSPLGPWSGSDWQLSDQVRPCDRPDENHDNRQVASPISGALAAALCLTQIRKLFSGDSSDIGWETRVDLNNPTIARCQLKSPTQLSENVLGGSESDLRSAPRDVQHPFSLRRKRRIQRDVAVLEELSVAIPSFTFRWLGSNVLVLKYVKTPSLLLHADRVEICHDWEAIVTLPRGYPIQPPVVMLKPVGRKGLTFHPNVTPEPPHLLCFGQHVPVLLLDELARRIQRMIILTPGAFMTNETDSLNPSACQFVRFLSRDKKLPLSEGVRLQEPLLKNASGKI